MTTSPLTVRAKVLDASVYPTASRRHLWLVRLQVEEVIDGELQEDLRELSVIVHSPSRDFHDSDPVGETFLITFEGPLTDPYAGGLKIAPDEPPSAEE